MKKVIVIGCPGAGKSTFSRKLSAKTCLPIHYLNMIWHLPDKTTLSRDEFIKRLDEIVAQPEWIIDGNYLHTLPLRLNHCDTVFYFDLPFNICLAGAEERVGRKREDMPWSEDTMDPEFRQWIIDFPTQQAPVIDRLLNDCNAGVNVIVFHSREEADNFIEMLPDHQTLR